MHHDIFAGWSAFLRTGLALRATRYSVSFAAAPLLDASVLATAEILKKVVRNSGTSICIGGVNTAVASSSKKGQVQAAVAGAVAAVVEEGAVELGRAGQPQEFYRAFGGAGEGA